MHRTDRHPSEWGFTDWINEARARLDEAEQLHARMVAGERVHRAEFGPPRNGAVGAVDAANRQACEDWDDLNADVADLSPLTPTPPDPVQDPLFDTPGEGR